jgi:hypothetical protein
VDACSDCYGVFCHAVTACSPMIDVQSYLEDLNATGDFSSFVMNVRKSFVASVQPHSQFS